MAPRRQRRLPHLRCRAHHDANRILLDRARDQPRDEAARLRAEHARLPTDVRYGAKVFESDPPPPPHREPVLDGYAKGSPIYDYDPP